MNYKEKGLLNPPITNNHTNINTRQDFGNKISNIEDLNLLLLDEIEVSYI